MAGEYPSWVSEWNPEPPAPSGGDDQNVSPQQNAMAVQSGQNVPQDLGQNAAPSGGGADLASLYQTYLGRGVDPSGAATFANMSSQDVINSILNSPEYAGRSAAGLSPSAADVFANLQASQIGFITAPVGMDPRDYAANGFDSSGRKKQSLFASPDPTKPFNFTNPIDFQTKDYQTVSKGNPFSAPINNAYMALYGRPATPTELLNESKLLAKNPDDYGILLDRLVNSSEAAAAQKAGRQNLMGGVAAHRGEGGDSGDNDRAAIDPLTQTTQWLGMDYGLWKPSEESGLSKITNDIGGMIPYAALATMTGGAASALGAGAIGAGAIGGATAGAARGGIEGGDVLQSALTGAIIGGVTGGVFDYFGNPIDGITADDLNMGRAMQNMPAQNPYNNFDFGSFTSPTFDLNSTIAADVFTPQELEAWRLGQQDASAAINTGTQSAGNPSYLTPEAQPYFPDEFPPLNELNQPIDPYQVQDVMQQSRNVDALPNTPEAIDTATKTTLLEDIQSGSQDALNWAKENPYSAAGILGATTLGILGLAGEGPLKFLGDILGTAKKKDDTPTTTPKPNDKTKDTPKSGPNSGVRINPKTGKPYGAGELDPNYLLRNRINASNVYSGATNYTKPFAQGGEVKHFGLGGLSDGLTKVFQPIEKSVVQPIGRAVPILKDALPYAGMIAAPFIASPIAAAGVGALASGIGQGGFNLKRALMGGISAYGLSNLGAGVEAAGSLTPAVETAGVSIPTEANNFFRSPETMSQGLQNLARGGDSYKLAAANFATKAGTPSAAMSIMGAAGVNAVNEGITQQNEANQAQAQVDATGAARQARIDRQKQTALDTVKKYPFQFAMGGSIDDEYGTDNMNTQSGNMQNGFMGYAMGGRFLSGGGDGMSDSIHASIEGNQEARLADGEFVIPADVVSHIGNGSSKAGAKQLYNMMDRIRQARTGNKKQGREIKPNKFMPA